MKHLSFRQIALGADTSNLTGTPWFVGDFQMLSISVQSSTASASLCTVIGTNDDGLRAALGTPSQTVPANGWSIITALAGQGLYEFDPGALGFRWINVFRDGFAVSAASNTTITFVGRT